MGFADCVMAMMRFRCEVRDSYDVFVRFWCGVRDSYDVLVVNSGCGVYSDVGVINN